jgi:hypothetical protein
LASAALSPESIFELLILVTEPLPLAPPLLEPAAALLEPAAAPPEPAAAPPEPAAVPLEPAAALFEPAAALLEPPLPPALLPPWLWGLPAVPPPLSLELQPVTTADASAIALMNPINSFRMKPLRV